jgi:rSAM/selenodomain-associated transferase 2
MKISVIIPALNEEASIGELVGEIFRADSGGLLKEVMVVDGQSQDRTVEAAERAGARVLQSEVARRSVQMNAGAQEAAGDVLYFLHADCRPPEGFLEMIAEAVKAGKPAGCFRRDMKSKRKKLGWIGFSSRLPGRIFRGGDASLYIRRELFKKINGFNPEMILMEDYEILKRIRPHARFHVINSFIQASDRKHRENPSLRVFIANVMVYSMYLFGFSQQSMLNTYRRMVSGTRYQ